jgi:TctA family transporter
MFQVAETLVIGVFGYGLKLLGFHPAPILLGFVLGPRFEESFRRAMVLSRGDLFTFLDRPISAAFIGLCVTLIVAQIYARLRSRRRRLAADPHAVPEGKTEAAISG